MKIAFFSSKPYDKNSFVAANSKQLYDFAFLDVHLNAKTAVLAQGYETVCAFVNDDISKDTIEALHQHGVKHIAMRCAGYNNVDTDAAKQHGIIVSRVPAYSPYAVAEHTVALLLALNRKVHHAHNRVRDGNFALDGLLGFDIFNRTFGLIGTGKIGICTAKIMRGFGCKVIAYDPFPSAECEALGVELVDLDTLIKQSHIISLHCPLTPETKYLINDKSIAQMQNGVTILNTSRGALIDSQAAIRGLKTGKIGHLGLDVYEEESDLFFEDLSGHVIQDDVFARLTTFPNVIITGHQAFFTKEALSNIADTTLFNVKEFEQIGSCQNSVE